MIVSRAAPLWITGVAQAGISSRFVRQRSLPVFRSKAIRNDC